MIKSIEPPFQCEKGVHSNKKLMSFSDGQLSHHLVSSFSFEF